LAVAATAQTVRAKCSVRETTVTAFALVTAR
jgi:hypothetical protein